MQSGIDKELDILYDYVQEMNDLIEKQIFYAKLREIEMEVEERNKRKLSKSNLCKLVMDKFEKER